MAGSYHAAPAPEGKAGDVLDRILARLAASPDPLIAEWARRLAKGDRVQCPGCDRVQTATREDAPNG